MKKNVCLICLLGALLTSAAQAPQMFNYQAVVRDINGQALPGGSKVAIRFQIHDGSESGAIVYSEIASAATNPLGLINLQIGANADLSVVDWANGAKYLEVAVDVTGGDNFTIMGASQLLSVPYALYAGKAGNDASNNEKGLNLGLSWNCYTHTLTDDGFSVVLDNCNGTFGTTGPTGATGKTGPTGPAGLQGLQGQKGATGITGAAGVTGKTGPTGLSGSNGLNGVTGKTGTTGATGPAGPTGLKGMTGTTGATGLVGAVGPTGTKGSTGPTGPTGQTGSNGFNGLPGSTGATGQPGVTGPTGSPGTNGINGTNGLNGATGLPGPSGATGPQGVAGTNGSNGSNGITGATGQQGPSGNNGLNGAQGTTGAQGPSGPSGSDGINGTTGATGAQGVTGLTGPSGPQGSSGTNGSDGINGAAGLPGATGPAGATGVQGPTGPSGNSGVDGTNGATGTQGLTGPTGPAGAQGASGSNGLNGSTGTAGQNGITGPTGADGSNGLNGATGAPGAPGATGSVNVNGTTNYVIKFISDSAVGNSSIYDNGNVGIGTTAPSQTLEVVGTIKTTNFQITHGADSGYVLQSDANGNASWVNPAGLLAGAIRYVGNSYLGITSGAGGAGSSEGTLSGLSNIAIGDSAGYGNKGGENCVALGSGALFTNDQLADEIAIGKDALYSVYAQEFPGGDVAIGTRALYSSSSAFHSSVAIGYESQLNLAPAAGYNTSVGYQSLHGTGDGDFNSAFGAQALGNTTDGMNNAAIGFNAGQNNSSGSNNTFIGYGANAVSGSLNNATAIGANSSVSESNALILGNGAKVGIGTSSPDTTLHVVGKFKYQDGTQANGYLLQSDSNGKASWVNPENLPAVALRYVGNSYLGITSGAGSTGSSEGTNGNHLSNINIGDGAGSSNSNGYSNIAIGSGALAADYGNAHTIAIGDSALFNLSADHLESLDEGYGEGNIAIGSKALFLASYGINNTAVGFETLKNYDGEGGENTALGYEAQHENISGILNIGIGSGALYFNQIGNSNTALGYQSLYRTQGGSNSALGNLAGATNNAGSSNTFIGAGADAGSASLSNATAIGANAIVSESNALILGNAANVGIGTSAPSCLLANTDSNIIGSDGRGINSNSLCWQQNTGGYTIALYNASTTSHAQGLEVKIAGTAATNRLMDLSTASYQTAQGTAVMVVQGNGNVGIGTGAPDTTLHIVGKFKYQDGTQASGYVLQSDANGNASWVAPSASVLAGNGLSYSGTTLNSNWTSSGNNIYSNNSGNVGIGTNAPAKALDVASSGGIGIEQTADTSFNNELYFADNGQVRSHDNNHRIVFDRANNIMEMREFGDIMFSAGSTNGYRQPTVTFKNSGYVGIGTTSPASTLEVDGTMGMAVKSGQTKGTNNPDGTATIWLYAFGSGTISLPSAATYPSRMYVLVNQGPATTFNTTYYDLTNVTINTFPANTALWLISDGFHWLQIK